MRGPLPDDLPKPSFRRIDDALSRKPLQQFDALARSFGYCGGEKYQRPETYIRHTEPLESDLLKQVEYDMDEQDLDWLQGLNAQRRKEQHGPVSQEIFEVIMDQLEKEWFMLMKRVPKPDMDLPAEDSCCAVCDDGEGENSNAIVFCDGCNLAVHQDCYGVPYIPEGQWLCRKCTVSPEAPVSCLLCPNEGGAFKQTSSGHWAHLLCAIWIPEVVVQNQVFMEPIEHIENISKSRWRLRCSICKEPKGACIQCDIKSCYSAFHVSCARKQKFLCSMKTLPDQEEQPLRAFCERHLPQDMAETRNAYLKDLKERAEEIKRIRQSSKAARAYARTYKTGIPLVPQYIVTRVMDYIGKVTLRKKPHVVLAICKYWSLKREARRGAPLLKRLHLEPWTTATSAAQQTEEDRLRKLEYLKHLRHDLGKLKEKADAMKQRELVRIQQIEDAIQQLASILYPHESALQRALEKISALDELNLFRTLESKSESPDYHEKVATPMCWSMIQDNLKAHRYWDSKTFKNHVSLVWNNAMLYYPPDHEMHLLASKIREKGLPVLDGIPASVNGSASYEPAIDRVKHILDEGDNPEGASLLKGLMTSFGEPNWPLIDALVKQSTSPKKDPGETLHSFIPTTSPTTQRPVEDALSSELTSSHVPVLTPSPTKPPKKPPRVRDRKAEKERRLARLALQAQLQQEQGHTLPPPRATRRNGPAPAVALDTLPSSSHATPRKASALSAPQPQPIVDVTMQDPVETASTTSTSRKRKRGEYEESPEDNDPTSLITKDGFKPEPDQLSIPQSTDDTMAISNSNLLSVVSPQTSAPVEEAADSSKAKKPKLTREQINERKRIQERERRARRKAEAEAAALRREKQLAEGSNMREGTSSHTKEGDSSSVSSLTDIEEERDDEAPEGGARVRPARSKTSSKNQGPSSSRPSKQPKSVENGGGEAAQVGPSTHVEAPKKSSGRIDREKREEIMGPPPTMGEGGLEGGTLVWAKQEGHPWFPGVIYEPDDERIPAKIHNTKEWFCQTANLTEEERETVQIVQFMDPSGTWAWLALRSIRMLFESEERDQLLLHARFRNNTLKNQVRAAYTRAQMERELEGAEEEETKMNTETLDESAPKDAIEVHPGEGGDV